MYGTQRTTKRQKDIAKTEKVEIPTRLASSLHCCQISREIIANKMEPISRYIATKQAIKETAFSIIFDSDFNVLRICKKPSANLFPFYRYGGFCLFDKLRCLLLAFKFGC